MVYAPGKALEGELLWGGFVFQELRKTLCLSA